MQTSRIAAVAAAVALAATSTVLMPAGQAAAPKPKVVAGHLLSPLTAAVDDDGTAYVTQNFGGKLTRIRPGKKPRTIYTSKAGHEVGGVSVLHGRVVFTETTSDEQGRPVASQVRWITPKGKVRTIARVRAFENAHNPDHRITYGARGISSDCAAQWPTDKIGPATYRGQRDSHPYATFQTDEGTVFVADAGMNAVLAISPKGRIRTVAVTPAAPVKITAALADGTGLPDCAVGLTYYGESVPTDVALDGRGGLVVSTEGGGLGEQMPLGAVYRIALGKHTVRKVAGGLFAAVGVAVAPRGDIFVSQLFGNEISRIKRGTHRARPFAKVPMPAAVEWTSRGLYATVNVLAGPSEQDPTAPPAGRLVRFRR